MSCYVNYFQEYPFIRITLPCRGSSVTCAYSKLSERTFLYALVIFKLVINFVGGSGHDRYLSVTNYTLTASVFDLFIISACKWLIIFLFSYESERKALNNLVRKITPDRRLLLPALITALAVAIFTIVKVSVTLCAVSFRLKAHLLLSHLPLVYNSGCQSPNHFH